MIDAILAASRLYNRFPSMGQNRDEIQPDLRSFVVSPYIDFYRPTDVAIEVLRVLHGARNINRLIESED